MKAHLGTIASAGDISDSPLDPTKSLWVTSPWAEFLPHLKLAVVTRGLGFSFAVSSDEELKAAYLADTSVLKHQAKAGQPRRMRDIVEEPDLLVVRAGVLGYKNVAMPGILLEALQLRQAVIKPFWVVDQPDLSLEHEGHLAHSPFLIDFLSRNATRLKLAEPLPASEIAAPSQSYQPSSAPRLTESRITESNHEKKKSSFKRKSTGPV
jgi:hypothetical protein